MPHPPIRIKTINHVGVPVSERSKSLPFYHDLVGLKVIPAMENGKSLVWMETEDHTMVHNVEGAPIPHVAFEVEDFDAALASVRAAGIEIIKGPQERADGQRAFYCFDPDGNRLEFTTARNIKPLARERVVDEWGHTSEV